MARHTLAELVERHREALAHIEDLMARHERKKDGIRAAEKHLRELRDARLEAERNGDDERARELDKLAKETVDKIAARRDERHELHDRITEAERKDAIREATIEARRGRKLDTIAGLDGCAMPRGHKLWLLDCRENGWGGRVNSADRTAANCDRYSDKSSQAELWAAYQNGTGAPANPPASYCSTCGGTHEYVNDGTAYPGELKGKKLPWWGMGTDNSLGDELLAVSQRLGYKVRRPYGNEPWHFNFVGDPMPVLRERGRV